MKSVKRSRSTLKNDLISGPSKHFSEQEGNAFDKGKLKTQKGRFINKQRNQEECLSPLLPSSKSFHNRQDEIKTSDQCEFQHRNPLSDITFADNRSEKKICLKPHAGDVNKLNVLIKSSILLSNKKQSVQSKKRSKHKFSNQNHLKRQELNIFKKNKNLESTHSYSGPKIEKTDYKSSSFKSKFIEFNKSHKSKMSHQERKAAIIFQFPKKNSKNQQKDTIMPSETQISSRDSSISECKKFSLKRKQSFASPVKGKKTKTISSISENRNIMMTNDIEKEMCIHPYLNLSTEYKTEDFNVNMFSSDKVIVNNYNIIEEPLSPVLYSDHNKKIFSTSTEKNNLLSEMRTVTLFPPNHIRNSNEQECLEKETNKLRQFQHMGFSSGLYCIASNSRNEKCLSVLGTKKCGLHKTEVFQDYADKSVFSKGLQKDENCDCLAAFSSDKASIVPVNATPSKEVEMSPSNDKVMIDSLEEPPSPVLYYSPNRITFPVGKREVNLAKVTQAIIHKHPQHILKPNEPCKSNEKVTNICSHLVSPDLEKVSMSNVLLIQGSGERNSTINLLSTNKTDCVEEPLSPVLYCSQNRKIFSFSKEEHNLANPAQGITQRYILNHNKPCKPVEQDTNICPLENLQLFSSVTRNELSQSLDCMVSNSRLLIANITPIKESVIEDSTVNLLSTNRENCIEEPLSPVLYCSPKRMSYPRRQKCSFKQCSSWFVSGTNKSQSLVLNSSQYKNTFVCDSKSNSPNKCKQFILSSNKNKKTFISGDGNFNQPLQTELFSNFSCNSKENEEPYKMNYNDTNLNLMFNLSSTRRNLDIEDCTDNKNETVLPNVIEPMSPVLYSSQRILKKPIKLDSVDVVSNARNSFHRSTSSVCKKTSSKNAPLGVNSDTLDKNIMNVNICSTSLQNINATENYLQQQTTPSKVLEFENEFCQLTPLNECHPATKTSVFSLGKCSPKENFIKDNFTHSITGSSFVALQYTEENSSCAAGEWRKRCSNIFDSSLKSMESESNDGTDVNTSPGPMFGSGFIEDEVKDLFLKHGEESTLNNDSNTIKENFELENSKCFSPSCDSELDVRKFVISLDRSLVSEQNNLDNGLITHETCEGFEQLETSADVAVGTENLSRTSNVISQSTEVDYKKENDDLLISLNLLSDLNKNKSLLSRSAFNPQVPANHRFLEQKQTLQFVNYNRLNEATSSNNTEQFFNYGTNELQNQNKTDDNINMKIQYESKSSEVNKSDNSIIKHKNLMRNHKSKRTVKKNLIYCFEGNPQSSNECLDKRRTESELYHGGYEDECILSGVEKLACSSYAVLAEKLQVSCGENTIEREVDTDMCQEKQIFKTETENSKNVFNNSAALQNRPLSKTLKDNFDTNDNITIEEFDEENSSSKKDVNISVDLSQLNLVKRNLSEEFEQNVPSNFKNRSVVPDMQRLRLSFESRNQSVSCEDEPSEESSCEVDIEEELTQDNVGSGVVIECSTTPNTKSSEGTQNEGGSDTLSFPPPLDYVLSKSCAADVLDSASKTRITRVKKGSLVERLRRLVRAEQAEVNMFHHEGAPRNSAGACSLRVDSVVMSCSRLVLSCHYTDACQPCSEEFSLGEEVVDPEVRIFVDPSYAKNVTSGCTILVYPPWRNVWLDERELMMMYCVSKIQLVTSFTHTPMSGAVSMPMPSVLQEFHCQSQDEVCRCRSELMSHLFSHSQTIPAQSWAEGSVLAALAAGTYPHNISLRLTILHRFLSRNHNGQLVCSVLCLDGNGHFCQFNLRSDDDELKLKNLLVGTDTKTLLFHKLTVCRRVHIDRCRGLRSMLNHLHQASSDQQVMYVVTPSSDQWSAQLTCTDAIFTIDPKPLMKLADAQDCEEGRVSGKIFVMALRRDKLYVWDRLQDTYFMINIAPSAMLPSFVARTSLQMAYVWAKEGEFTIDKFSVMMLSENNSQESVISIPPLTTDSVEGNLVLLDSIITKVNTDVYLRWEGDCGHKLLRLQQTELFYCVTCAQPTSSWHQKLVLEVCVVVSDLLAPIRVKVKSETAQVLLLGTKGHVSTDKRYNMIGALGSSLKCLALVLEVLKNPFGDILEFVLEEL